jgi:hypothetical protein
MISDLRCTLDRTKTSYTLISSLVTRMNFMKKVATTAANELRIGINDSPE